MSFNLPSIAKPLLVLSTAIALTSFYFGDQWSKANTASQAQIKRLVVQQDESRRAYEELSELLVQDKEEIQFTKAFADTTLAVMNLRVIHGVTINYMRPGKLGSGGGEQSLDQMSDPVPNSDLRSIRINLSGTYITYDSFRDYLKEIEKLPVSVVSLNVTGSNFELGLRIYGK